MKTISIISIVYGFMGLVWAMGVSIVMRIQKALLDNIVLPDEAMEYIDIKALMDSIFGMLGILMPIVILIGILYILSGILQLSGNKQFRPFIYLAAILNILWYISYMLLLQTEIIPLIDVSPYIPQGIFHLVIILGMLINAGFYCGYPIFLLFSLHRKNPGKDTLDTGYEN